MKKILLAGIAMMLISASSFAQKYALIDMDYILKKIPQYEMANEQLDQISKRWQSEVEALAAEAESMYKQYQADMVFLTADQKTAKENAIVAKEKEVQDLRLKYFGPEGELYQKRNSLVGHIQDDIYNAVKEIAERNNYSMVIDRSSAESIIFASPKIDISKEVLSKLGY
ncbi:MAG: OmpH family outer membrane protein [Bacteroidales bacterium]|jgi:outer membrane protein|nr:OmpH family outer membrane protein [Bacteroidales bacterium]